MGFDLATATPVKSGGFDLATATPVSGSSQADLIPGGKRIITPDVPEDNLLGKTFGLVEPVLAIGSGVVGSAVGGLAGVYKGLTSGKYGTQTGVEEANQYGGKITESMSYQPRTNTGQDLTRKIGNAVNDSGIIAASPLAEISTLGRSASPALSSVRDLANAGNSMAVDASSAAGTKIRSLAANKPTMAGVGAAATGDELIRLQRAADLPIPLKLTKGDASRDFDQVQFEKEVAKTPEGSPLRQRSIENNEKILQNLDVFIDETGAQTNGLRSIGKVVTDAVVNKMAKAKEAIRAAYTEARNSGHMNEEINVNPLVDFVNNNSSSSKTAPIISMIKQEIDRLSNKTPAIASDILAGKSSGTDSNIMITINNLEELRKAINKNIERGTPNEAFGVQAKQIIDAATEGKGGEKYQQARRMFENYSNEFKNTGVIDKMLRTKPGTIDRAVAYEDILDHAMHKGSLDDVRAVRRTLQTAGPEGSQAWKELQGGLLQKAKNEIFGGTSIDEAGNTNGSFAKFHKFIETLDADGKLDFIYGKQGAQKLRDLRDAAKDIYTQPPGSVNHSNTASALMAAIDLTISAISGLPAPLATLTRYGVKKVKSNRLSAKVADALNGGE